MKQYSHLVVLYVATAGQNDPDLLGSDEEEIIQISWLILDTVNNKVKDMQQRLVIPHKSDVSEVLLTESCKAETGVDEQSIRSTGQPLDAVLDELEVYMSGKVRAEEGQTYCLVTLGPAHLRQCLHVEACQKNVELQEHWHRYYDLRREFANMYQSAATSPTSPTSPTTSLHDMLQQLNIQPNSLVEYGLRQCQDIANVLIQMLADGDSVIKHSYYNHSHVMLKNKVRSMKRS